MEVDHKNKTILFYDGECALCNFWVQFCMERDRKQVLFFAPLQGDTAANLLPIETRTNLDSVVLWTEEAPQLKSKAVLTALRKIGYSPDVLLLARLFPTSFWDRLYDLVAKNRYRWFGKNTICPMPSDQQRQQLLH